MLRPGVRIPLALAVAALLAGAGCSGDDASTDGSAVTEPADTLAPPATVATPALPVGTDTPGTEVASDEPQIADVPVAVAVLLRSFGDGWSSIEFVRGGDAEWADLVDVGIDRSAASGIATAVVDGVTVTVIAAGELGGVDSDLIDAALIDAGARAIDAAGTVVYSPPSSRRTALGAALADYAVVGTANGILVLGTGDAGVADDLIAERVSRPVAAWEEAALLSATVLTPLYGADRFVATMGAVTAADAYHSAHPGATAARADAWLEASAAASVPASPLGSAAGVFGIDPATASGLAVALHATPDNATAAAGWTADLWDATLSYDESTTWADLFGAATTATDGTVLTLAVDVAGDQWLAAPLPLAWAATGGPDSPAD